MVKNTTGGTGTKGLARKHQVGGGDNGRIRLPECDLEQFALVTKMLGNGMCEVYTNDNVRMIGHIRNKFRGKQKRHNLLAIHTIVLVGLREWENPVKNCDILTMYDNSQIDQLRNIPNNNIKKVLELQLGSTFKNTNQDNVHFSNDIDEPSDSSTNAQQKLASKCEEFNLDEVAAIDIDDI
jgi:initiation factor 1A